MNNKAQSMGLVGALIMTFVAIIVGLAMFNGGITANVAGTTTLQSLNSTSDGTGQITMPTNGNTADLEGKLVTGFFAINESNGAVVPATNYTVLNNQINGAGVLTAQLQSDSTGGFSGNTINVSYTYQPVGYITSSGGRSLASLIIVFTALAIGIIALIPALRNSILEFG